MSINNEQALQVLEGAYDLHVHPNPDTKIRGFDDNELLKQLDYFKMAGAVIKLQNGETYGRAYLANRYLNAQATLYGSLVLCNAIGGLNPYAVEVAAKMGIKMLWFPTRDAAFDQTFKPAEKRTKGLYILDEYGNLKPEVYDILDIIQANNIAVSTGHLSLPEILMLCKESRRRQIPTIMTHPEYACSYVPLTQQIEMARLGVLIEKLWVMVLESYPASMIPAQVPPGYPIPIAKMADGIRQIGIENIILGTDAAEPERDSSPMGMYHFTEMLLKQGFSISELKIMACQSAIKVLAL